MYAHIEQATSEVVVSLTLRVSCENNLRITL